jgi:hypothetical protein
MGEELFIEADGTVRFIHDDDTAELLAKAGEVRTVRASHVEPSGYARNGRQAWTADLQPVGGPVLGPYASRTAALAAEVRWLACRLRRRGLQTPVEAAGGCNRPARGRR